MSYAGDGLGFRVATNNTIFEPLHQPLVDLGDGGSIVGVLRSRGTSVGGEKAPRAQALPNLIHGYGSPLPPGEKGQNEFVGGFVGVQGTGKLNLHASTLPSIKSPDYFSRRLGGVGAWRTPSSGIDASDRLAFIPHGSGLASGRA